jgi:serine/threonine protein kinase
MHTVRAANTEPIPGYRLIEPLGRGGFGEVWKCEAPGGLFKAIKFVPGNADNLSDSGGAAARELRALQNIKAIRHPYLLALERVELVDGDLLVVMELADKSLHDLFQEYRKAGRPGILREELLRYLREAAEVLDLMNRDYQLQHLDIKPHNLFLLHQHVKVADFGLVGDLSDGQDRADTKTREALTPLYSAPETFLGKLSRFADQYSLAITYQELLTGVLPLTGKNIRQLAVAHVQGKPDLTPLPDGDRPAVARALAKEPTERFASCLDFIRALVQATPGPVPEVARPPGTEHDLAPGEMGHTAVPPDVTEAPAGSARFAAVRAHPRPSNPGGPVSMVPGMQLLECVARLPVGEVWKAFNAGGDKRLVKLVLAPEVPQDGYSEDPVAILRELTHPALAPLEIIDCPGHRLALVSDPGDGSLYDRLKESQRDGLPGVPREELLAHLQVVAEALDDLQQTYRMQHLALTPKALVLSAGELRILDYGLMELLWMPAGHEAPAVNTRYCAPELFARQSSRACDQYSLALIFQELLTGVHAFRNLNARQMAAARLRGSPDVGLLPGLDRATVLRALHPDPDQRFRSCAEFIAALRGVPPRDAPGPAKVATRTTGLTVPVPSPPPPEPDRRQQSISHMRKVITDVVEAAAGYRETHATASLRYALHKDGPGAVPSLVAHCFGRMLPGTMRLKLKGFVDEWRAEVFSVAAPPAPAPGVPPAESAGSFAFFVRVASSLWQRALGRPPGLEVRLECKIPPTSAEGLTAIGVRIQPRGCTAEKAARILGETGPPILESLRNYLQLHTERRSEERFPYSVPLEVQPVLPTQELGPPFVAQGKDVSSEGLSLFLPCRLPTAYLYVRFPSSGGEPVLVPTRLIRTQPCPDGRVEAGLCFAWDEV